VSAGQEPQRAGSRLLNFVLNNPHLSAAISNMVDEKQVRENLLVVRA
jgi:hypothetical protein